MAEARVMADARRSKVWTRVVQEYGERSSLQINEAGAINLGFAAFLGSFRIF